MRTEGADQNGTVPGVEGRVPGTVEVNARDDQTDHW